MSLTRKAKVSRLRQRLLFLAAQVEGMANEVGDFVEAAERAVDLQNDNAELKAINARLQRKIERMEKHLRENGGLRPRASKAISKMYHHNQST